MPGGGEVKEVKEVNEVKDRKPRYGPVKNYTDLLVYKTGVPFSAGSFEIH
jgi:hypothetical protein